MLSGPSEKNIPVLEFSTAMTSSNSPKSLLTAHEQEQSKREQYNNMPLVCFLENLSACLARNVTSVPRDSDSMEDPEATNRILLSRYSDTASGRILAWISEFPAVFLYLR